MKILRGIAPTLKPHNSRLDNSGATLAWDGQLDYTNGEISEVCKDHNRINLSYQLNDWAGASHPSLRFLDFFRTAD